MLFTGIVAWLGISCAFIILDGWYWPSTLPRLTEKFGFKDAEERRRVVLIAKPLAMIVVVPLAYASYADQIGNQRLATAYVLFAAALFTGFFAVLIIASWTIGLRCFSLGLASVVLSLSTPAFGVAAYFQSAGDDASAERLWIPATMASIGAVVVRFSFQLKEDVKIGLRLRRHKRRHSKSRQRHRSHRRP